MTPLKAAYAFLRLYALRDRVPVTANISVTDRCNFSCTHCRIPERRLAELSAEQIFSMVDALDAAGTMKISLCGGEPLVRQDIGRIIDYITSKNIMVNIVTNGALVPEKIDEIKNLDFIVLSYDGSPEAQKNVRGERAYELALRAMDAAQSRGIAVVTATVLTRENIGEIDEILRLGREKGFTCQFHPVYGHSYSGPSVDRLLPEKADMMNAADKLLRIRQGDKPEQVVLSRPTLEHLKHWPEFKRQKCWAGNAYVYIDTDGRMYPCIQMMGVTEGVPFFSRPLKDGLRALKRLPCRGCWCLSNIEYNYLFSLHPKVIWNSYMLARSFKRRTTPR